VHSEVGRSPSKISKPYDNPVWEKSNRAEERKRKKTANSDSTRKPLGPISSVIAHARMLRPILLSVSLDTYFFWLKTSFVLFLIRWKYPLLVEDLNCGWKAGGGIDIYLHNLTI
jgi:hypothetical protein